MSTRARSRATPSSSPSPSAWRRDPADDLGDDAAVAAVAEIALMTERRYETLDVDNPYTDNIRREDEILIAALSDEGFHATRIDWSRRDVDWSRYDALLLRTMWDYFDRFDEFCAWLDAIDGVVPVFNELSTVRWNMDKHYLLDLRDRGIPIVPTLVLERGDTVSLRDVLAEYGWSQAVIKPAVSGAARHTYRVDARDPSEPQAQLDRLLADESFLVQPFMPDIVERGEVTVVVMDGECTHAVLKVAKPGDFRVQDDHGGTVHPHPPSAAESALAARAIAAVSPSPLYGRVDMVRDEKGGLAVMELELIEPELWLRFAPESAQRIAQGLRRRLS
jgi:glutathione synthase/RimK-type ligase-like ATP-grasp enzyme